MNTILKSLKMTGNQWSYSYAGNTHGCFQSYFKPAFCRHTNWAAVWQYKKTAQSNISIERAITGLLSVLIYALINGDKVNSFRENQAIE